MALVRGGLARSCTIATGAMARQSAPQGNFVNLSPSGVRARALDEDGAAVARSAQEFALPRTAVLDGRFPRRPRLDLAHGAHRAGRLATALALERARVSRRFPRFTCPGTAFWAKACVIFRFQPGIRISSSAPPFAGDPQSGWMYFPAMFFFTILPPVAAYKWFLIFHLALAGTSTYVFARTLKMGVIGSLAAAAAYEFGPFVNHISCCLIHIQLAVWIPPALLGIELAHRSERRWTRIAWWCFFRTGGQSDRRRLGPARAPTTGCWWSERTPFSGP